MRRQCRVFGEGGSAFSMDSRQEAFPPCIERCSAYFLLRIGAFYYFLPRQCDKKLLELASADALKTHSIFLLLRNFRYFS
uniref:Uncharacterized protein n=1 Tax=Leptospirillum ferrodiazotrophum TaxID=412449 RepID=C6HZI9_9BACT|nr:MAG: hypothetical protein UBAL3_95320047 [Leptospirillum ferrodiazotrophum]